MCFGKIKDSIDKDSKPSEHEYSREAERKSRTSLIVMDPKFLIVGAGAAGLACAVELIKHGFREVIVVEAEDRIGGRIDTIAFGDNVVDLGAQWCHGEGGNVVFDLVKDKDLLESTADIYVTFQCVRSNGELVPDSIVQCLKNILAEVFTNRTTDLRSFHGSFGDYLTKQFFRRLMEDEFADINRTIAKEFFENFKKIESSETAAGVDEVSATGFDEYWECEGDYLLNWRDKGFFEFLRVLLQADTMGNDLGVLEGRIIFNTRVKEIAWDRPDSKVEVMCDKTDDVFLVDHVILTCSLGVLKEHFKEMFEPELPPTKVRAIEGIGFGAVCKIYLEFQEPFWDDNWPGFTTLWREEDSIELRETSNAWLEEIYGFYRVSYQPRILVAWIVGKVVYHVETLKNEVVKDGCMYLLKRFLPNWNIPQPIKLAKTMWKSNNNFYGSYSFRSLQTEAVGTSATELAQPLTIIADAPMIEDDPTTTNVPLSVKPVVLFAGEATSAHFYGTVHGAVESGRREAQRMSGYYSVDL